MKKVRIVLVVVVLVILVSIALYVRWLSLPSVLPQPTAETGVCAQYGISFDSSSVESIFLRPEAILRDPAAFWATDPAYGRVAQAPIYRGAATPPEGWEREIEKVQGMPADERLEEAAYLRTQEIMAHSETFCAEAIPLLRSLLPGRANLSSTVYVTAFNNPGCFAYRSDVVMMADGPLFFGKTSVFFSILAHELFHIGYFDHQPYQTEARPEDYPLRVILTTLHNDGMAVFVQHELAAIYPKPLEMDLMLLDSGPAVSLLIKRVNRLLEQAGTIPEDQAMAAAFQGINGRALYVVGAHMARTIDRELGREALAATVATGPRSFIRVYNSVADESQRIRVIAEPDELAPSQVLRLAAVQGDAELVVDTLGQMERERPAEPGGEVFEDLMNTGFVLETEHPELAIRAFELLVALFPDHPFSHLNLGEACGRLGDTDCERECCARAIELDPRLAALIR
jgi:hypothetical protein